jgi:hypothetical protein
MWILVLAMDVLHRRAVGEYFKTMRQIYTVWFIWAEITTICGEILDDMNTAAMTRAVERPTAESVLHRPPQKHNNEALT